MTLSVRSCGCYHSQMWAVGRHTSHTAHFAPNVSRCKLSTSLALELGRPVPPFRITHQLRLEQHKSIIIFRHPSHICFLVTTLLIGLVAKPATSESAPTELLPYVVETITFCLVPDNQA